MIPLLLLLAATQPAPPPEPGAPLDLSITQEADAALDRARRWLTPRLHTLRLQTAGTNATLNAWLLAYAATQTPIPPPPQPLPLPPPLAIPPLARTWLPDGPDIPPQTPITNRYHFAVQRTLAPHRQTWPHQDAPLPHWREELARRIINTQRITPQGTGHWATPDETLWAILTLRALLRESPPVTPPAGATSD